MNWLTACYLSLLILQQPLVSIAHIKSQVRSEPNPSPTEEVRKILNEAFSNRSAGGSKQQEGQRQTPTQIQTEMLEQIRAEMQKCLEGQSSGGKRSVSPETYAKCMASAQGLARNDAPRQSPDVIARRALAVAQQKHDDVGTAHAYRLLALTVGEGNNTAEKRVAWREAARAWERAGDAPGMIEALCESAVNRRERFDEGTSASRRLKVALALGRLEKKRPVAAARVLNFCGILLYNRALEHKSMEQLSDPALSEGAITLTNSASYKSQAHVAGVFFEGARAILTKHAPDSLEMAAALHNLAVVREGQGDRNTAQGLSMNALALSRKASSSLPTAAILYLLSKIKEQDGAKAEAQKYHNMARDAMSKSLSRDVDFTSVVRNVGLIAGVSRSGTRAVPQLHAVTLEPYQALARSSVAGAPHDLALEPELPRDPSAPNFLSMTASRQPNPGGQKTTGDALKRIEEMLADQVTLKRGGTKPPATTQQQREEQTARTEEAKKSDADAKLLFDILGFNRGTDFFSDAMRDFSRSLNYRQLSDLVAEGRPVEAWRLAEEWRLSLFKNNMIERSLLVGDSASAVALTDRQILVDSYAEPELYSFLRPELLSSEEQSVGRLLDTPQTGDELQIASAELLAADWRAEDFESKMMGITMRRAELMKQAEKTNGAQIALTVPEGVLASLQGGDLYISFAIGPQTTFVFLADKSGGVKAYPVNTARQKLYDMYDRLRRSVAGTKASQAGSGEQKRRADDDGRQMFAALFTPAARTKIGAARRLFISPEGFLWNLPFAALVTNENGMPRYLGLEKRVVLTQSLSLLRYQSAPTATSKRLLSGGSAVVVGVSRSDAGGATKMNHRCQSLDELVHAGDEARAIAAMYKVSPLLNENATESALKQRIEGAEILHIASHAVAQVSPEQAMSSGICLVPSAQSNSPHDDGMLQAWEVFTGLRLQAKLVVLSACGTGRGPVGLGDGFGRMTRALQAAGAQAVVASLWDVNDESTRVLMEAMHESLRRGVSKDEALRFAMERLSHNPDTSHPYFWSAFVLVGNPDATRAAAR